MSEPKRYGLSRETCDIVEWRYGPYVGIEDYQKIEDKCQRYKAEVERLTLLQAETLAERNKAEAEVERLKLNYYKTGEVSATIVQTFNTETGEADYVVSLEDYKKMAGMFNAEFLRLQAEVERLTKAGDNLVYLASEDPVSEPFIKAWFAAKDAEKDGKDVQ